MNSKDHKKSKSKSWLTIEPSHENKSGFAYEYFLEIKAPRTHNSWGRSE